MELEVSYLYKSCAQGSGGNWLHNFVCQMGLYDMWEHLMYDMSTHEQNLCRRICESAVYHKSASCFDACFPSFYFDIFFLMWQKQAMTLRSITAIWLVLIIQGSFLALTWSLLMWKMRYQLEKLWVLLLPMLAFYKICFTWL